MNEAGIQDAAADFDPAAWPEFGVERDDPNRLDGRLAVEGTFHVADDLFGIVQRLLVAESDKVILRGDFIDLHG